MKTYAFIPARGNSKRVPGKNFKLLNGKPLIYWTIKAALESDVDMVYFSTEDSRLAEKANDMALTELDRGGKRFGILNRNPKLSQDHTQTDEVYLDMLRTIEMSPFIDSPDTLVLLQPTSPLRNADDINNALAQWRRSNQEGCLFSGYQVDGFLWRTNPEDYFLSEPISHDPRFRLGKQWIKDTSFNAIENGAIYITSAEQFGLYRTYRFPPYQFFEMDQKKSVDIDTPKDFMKAAELANFV